MLAFGATENLQKNDVILSFHQLFHFFFTNSVIPFPSLQEVGLQKGPIEYTLITLKVLNPGPSLCAS